MTGTAAPAVPTPTLSAADRCDRCGAQARVRVVLAAGELTFCTHHAREHEAALRSSALEWLDESALIS